MEQKNSKNNEVEIDIIPILKVLLSKLWLIILIGGVVACAVFGATKMMIKPSYRCGFSAYVNNQHATQESKSTLSNQDLIAAQHLTKTFSYILKSNTILTASLQSIDSDLSYDDFSKMVSTEIKDETELIMVYVVTKDPTLSYDLANAIAKTAPAYMSDIVEGSSMKIVDNPVYSGRRYKPSYVQYALFGFIFGALLASVIVLIRFFKDDTIRSEDEIEQSFGLPILGVLPDNSSAGKGEGYYSSEYGYGYGYGKSAQKAGEEAEKREK